MIVYFYISILIIEYPKLSQVPTRQGTTDHCYLRVQNEFPEIYLSKGVATEAAARLDIEAKEAHSSLSSELIPMEQRKPVGPYTIL